MLRKTRKLNLAWPENHSFYRVFHRCSGKLLSIYTKEKLVDAKVSRATIVVGKKVSKLATKRNQIKRQLYSFLSLLKIWKKQQDIVVVVQRLAKLETYLSEIQRLLALGTH